MIAHKDTPLDAVLDAIMLAEPEPSHAALARWSARYPEHREALASFFATWAVQQELPLEVRVDEGRVAERVTSRALELLDRELTAGVASLPRLSAVARRAGISEAQLAAKCDLDETIIAKLDRRLVRVATIPLACLERLGAELGRGVEAIREMLDGAPVALAGGRYKSRGRPQAVAQDFVEAVRASTLPEDVKRKWIDAGT